MEWDWNSRPTSSYSKCIYSPKHGISPAPIEQFDLILLRKNLVLLGDFNSRKKKWDKNLTRNTRMGNILEDTINQHNLFLLTYVDQNCNHSDLNENSGKSTIDLTLVRGLSNLHIRTRTFDHMRYGHWNISKWTRKKRKNDWSIWERIVDTRLKNFQDSFPTIINLDIIDPETSALTPSEKIDRYLTDINWCLTDTSQFQPILTDI